MKFLADPFVIQNTEEHGWLVTWTNALVVRVGDEPVESVSFTVQLPRRADLTISEVQIYALKRAAELLEGMIQDIGARTRE